ncbi:MAG: glycosyl hydrolase family 28 protein [Bacilli bacterium]|nr:glycosyl hydrolase family 28 protein [Bacilli bacterium]
MAKLNVTKYGVVGDGVTLNTKALQDLIDKHANKNNIIVFPKGTYVLSTIYLRNGTNIHFNKGTVILGSKDFSLFGPDEVLDYPTYQDESHSYFHSSLFVAENVNDIHFSGYATIDMQSVWDEENIRKIVHRGCKVFAFKNVNNYSISDVNLLNATDLALYVAGCNYGEIKNVKMRVYIDGISPDNCHHLKIHDCEVEAGDDALVFKSSYTLNRLEICDDIKCYNLKLKSRCNAIKFGTETNGGFKNIHIRNCDIRDCRITGISVESVDGGHLDNITFKDIIMKNVGAPLFVHLGHRLRGPEGTTIGSIKNIHFENVKAVGPYRVYKCVPWNYVSYVAKDTVQFPGFYSKQKREPVGTWQITSNFCGLEGHNIENITFKDIYFELDGGVKEFNPIVPEKAPDYPEVYAYGRILPSYGMYFRYVDGIKIDNFIVKLNHEDAREEIIYDKCINY